MADERKERDRKDDGSGAERDPKAGGGERPDEGREVAGDVDARRLEITPERPNRRPPS
jgi:hypothetical protein